MESKTTDFVSSREKVLSAHKSVEGYVPDPTLDGKGCHGGNGVIGCGKVLAEDNYPVKDRFVPMFHDDILPPGCSIGYHKHERDVPFEEYYYIASGTGLMQLDGEEFQMTVGDISVCLANGSHGIINNSEEDLRIIVFVARAPQGK